MARQALADITPPAESGAIDISPDATSANEPEAKKHPQSWDSPCVSKECPIKHPHNYGLRPQTLSAPIKIWQDADAVVSGDPESQPPPLIAAMIDTLCNDQAIMSRYPSFTDILRDFYRAHGGRSDKYHGPAGMFGHGVHLNGDYGSRVYPYHKHPDGTSFMFEIELDDALADTWYTIGRD